MSSSCSCSVHRPRQDSMQCRSDLQLPRQGHDTHTCALKWRQAAITMLFIHVLSVQTHRYLYNVSNYGHQCDSTLLYYNSKHLPSSTHWALAISCTALVTSAQRRKIWLGCMFALLLQPTLRLVQTLCHGWNLLFLYIVLQAHTLEQFPRHGSHYRYLCVSKLTCRG